jgi:NADP-dependent 3-hydroxy acid dehydrogenase YdfG
MNEFYAIAIDADAIARAIASAIEQPGDFDVNEIIIGSRGQEL